MSATFGNGAAADGMSLNRAAYDGVLARIALVMQEKPTDNHPVCLICGRPVAPLAGVGVSIARGYCRCGYTHALARRPA